MLKRKKIKETKRGTTEGTRVPKRQNSKGTFSEETKMIRGEEMNSLSAQVKGGRREKSSFDNSRELLV